jgi:putative tryptophan/tyrosine transport system substrate-binding protein
VANVGALDRSRGTDLGVGRRVFVAMLTAAAAGSAFLWPCAVGAQQQTYRIGLLATGGPMALIDAQANSLRELGYVEGKNVSFERRFADGKLDRLAGLAAELVKLRVDIILTQGTPATIAAKEATASIPIVFSPLSDPVGVGLVASLARPGGNVTGTSLMATDISAKRLELLHTVLPRVSGIAILWDSSNPGMALRVRETKMAADQSRIILHTVGPRNLEELESSIAELMRLRPDALIVTAEPFTRRHLTRILEYASSSRLPTMFEDRSYVDAGGLMSYGPSLIEGFRRAAVYVDKVLKGSKPADLPVEQPTKFELVINLKTAKALGLIIPESFLLRADTVIE